MLAAHSLGHSRHIRRRQTDRRSGLLVWSRVGDVWIAHIDNAVAGCIERRGHTYRVLNWLGEPVDASLTLAGAKRYLEPSRLAAMRDEIYRRDTRQEAHLSGVIVTSVILLGGIAGTLLVQAPI
ncbi:hypothetical protein [Naasia lichenicola]|uniref:Uncharacterized protein n=1 Tax=Naasia lichenicola TaxID=2565933 RepID=A0A4S4FIY4_9MICO|nr:hypothetical protein [Naasia lichenicola]THG30061.1 hypothetical protein E6C64_15600 [Naasia lichenicola]